MRNRIETLRGCACVLLVVYHVIGAGPDNGLRISEGALRTANDMLALIRMPLFALVAGWVYAFKPALPSTSLSFLRNKAARLLIPMACAGCLFISIQRLTPGVNLVYSGIPFIWPVAHLWFVQAIFLIFAFVCALDALRLLNTTRVFVPVFAGACVIYLVGSPVQIFALGGATYLLPFFLLGLGIGRFPEWLSSLERPSVQLGLLLLIAIEIYASQVTADRHSALFLIVGIALSAIAAGSSWRSSKLAYLAKYSFAIYLFHVFFTAGSRILLERVGVTSLPIHVVTGVTAGIVGPWLLQILLEGRPVANFLLLGKRLPDRTAFAPRKIRSIQSA